MKRYGEAPISGQVYQDRPGAYGIVLDGMDMLLVAEQHPAIGTLEVQLPGGGIDPGESPLQALHREIMEETGYRVAVERRIGSFQRYCYMAEYDKWARKIANVFLCRPVYQVAQPDELTVGTYWAPIGEAPNLMTVSADAAFLDEVSDDSFVLNRPVFR